MSCNAIGLVLRLQYFSMTAPFSVLYGMYCILEHDAGFDHTVRLSVVFRFCAYQQLAETLG